MKTILFIFMLVAQGCGLKMDADPKSVTPGQITADTFSIIVEMNENMRPEENTSTVINQSSLRAISSLVNAEDLIFEVIEIPTQGSLNKDGQPLVIGDTYTQKDINQNKISYLHNGSLQTKSDSFKFIVKASEHTSEIYEYPFQIKLALPIDCSYLGSQVFYRGQDVNLTPPQVTGSEIKFRAIDLPTALTLNPVTGVVSGPLDQLGSFDIRIEAYNDEGATSCVSDYTVENPLIATTDVETTVQGSLLKIPVTQLMSNDINQAGYSFNITAIKNVVGGSAQVVDGKVEFNPTAIWGDPAQFTYVIEDSEGNTSEALVNLTIEQLPPTQALIYGADEITAVTAKINITPPSMTDVFNSWARFSGENYFANRSVATGEGLAWQFVTNPDRVETTINSAAYMGLISPDKLENYNLSVQLSSQDPDDDAISIVVAFVRENGKNYHISAVRSHGGFCGPNLGWGLYFNFGSSDQLLIGELSVGGVVLSPSTSGTLGWINRSTNVKIERKANIIKIWASEWNNPAYAEESLITLDLNSNSRYDRFKGNQSYGFGAYSQPRATYKNITLEGGANQNKILDVANNLVWEYVMGIGWTSRSLNLVADIGYPREVTNPETGRTYIIDRNGVVTLKP